MRQTLRLAVLVGILVMGVTASAIPSYAAGNQSDETIASDNGRLAQMAERAGRTATTSTQRAVPPRSDNGADRGRKYIGEQSVNKRWWWWSQSVANSNNSNPDDGGDDTIGGTQTPDSASTDDARNKVTICHIPPGNPANAHTISVSPNAVPAHLAHGDTLGACPGDGTPSAP